MGVYKMELVESDREWYCFWRGYKKGRKSSIMSYKCISRGEGPEGEWVWTYFWTTHPTYGAIELQVWWNLRENDKSHCKILNETLAPKVVPSKFTYSYIPDFEY
jgi:hypothetical protein